MQRALPSTLSGILFHGLERVLLVVTAAATGFAVLAAEPPDTSWRDLFNGKTLSGWKVTGFGNDEEAAVADGQIVLKLGASDLSGITWRGGDLPRVNYEVLVETQRAEGNDFFCGLTFPYKENCCSLICGGWGGSLVGISSFDHMDASENETTKFIEFENKRWYSIRVRVTEGRIQAWIDGKREVDALPGTRKVSTRIEVERSEPLGIAAWNTKSLIRAIRIRNLTATEATADAAPAEAEPQKQP